MPVVELRSVALTYPGPPPVQAVRDASFEVDAGELVALIGPSGSGKSTILNLLGLLDVPSGGELRIRGTSVSEIDERTRTDIRASQVGMVFQQFHLIRYRTAVENVALGLLYAGMNRSDCRGAAEDALRLVGLGDRLHHRPTELSGGEQQRVAIARAIATSPSLLLCDEPTGNLDSHNGQAILHLLKKIARSGTATIVATHDPMIASAAERVIEMKDGRSRAPIR